MTTRLSAARCARSRDRRAIPATVRRAGEGSTSFVGSGTFRADALGRVQTDVTPSRQGTYRGIAATGLFWSARVRPAAPDDPPPDTVRVSAKVRGTLVASAVATARPDRSRMSISRDTPFASAVWAVPTTPGRHPVVIVLGGSEGGSATAREMAPLFAAHGFATLGLPYYDPGYDPGDRISGVPRSFAEIPVDRLLAVRQWIGAQANADADRIGVWGASKGAEFALIAASRYDWIKVVVAIVPTDLVWEGWGNKGPRTSSFALDGHALAFQPYEGMSDELAKSVQGKPMDLRRVHVRGRISHPDRVAAARIPIENFHGTLLVVGGGKDALWPSAEMAVRIAATRKAAREDTIVLTYPNAGHLLGGPGTEPAQPLTGAGGDAAAIARGRTGAWRTTFDTFDRTLRPSP